MDGATLEEHLGLSDVQVAGGACTAVAKTEARNGSKCTDVERRASHSCRQGRAPTLGPVGIPACAGEAEDALPTVATKALSRTAATDSRSTPGGQTQSIRLMSPRSTCSTPGR